MTRTPPTNIKIEDIGLQKHLDATTVYHRGKGYSDFIQMLEEYEMSKAAIARACNVQTSTVRKWIKVYEQEKELNK